MLLRPATSPLLPHQLQNMDRGAFEPLQYVTRQSFEGLRDLLSSVAIWGRGGGGGIKELRHRNSKSKQPLTSIGSSEFCFKGILICNTKTDILLAPKELYT